MRSLFSILLLLISLSCGEDIKEQKKEKDLPVKSQDSKENNANRIEAPPPPQPPLPKKETKLKKEKLEQELNEIESSIQRMVKESLANLKPSFQIYLLDAETSKQLLNLKCEASNIDTPFKFESTLLKSNVHSYEQTGKADGQQFCLYEIPGYENAKVIYNRTEGGHLSDQILLETMGVKMSHSLPLVSWYGKEGYERLITSELLNATRIKRKITERLGWRTASDKDGSEQPRSETTQLFKLLPNGNLELLSEEVSNYNFERYVD